MPLVISGLNEAFNDLSNRVVMGARQAMADVGAIVIDEIKANFDARGARGGREEWEPVPISWLAKRTTWPLFRSAQGTYIANHLPLVDDGRLRGSMVYKSQETADGNVEAAVEPSVGYARAHEEGVPGEIRQRSFMWITEEGYALATGAAAERMGEALTQ